MNSVTYPLIVNIGVETIVKVELVLLDKLSEVDFLPK